MSYLVKGLIGVAGCSGACGGGYLLVRNIGNKEDNRPTAKSLITKSGRTLLDIGSNQWAERWSEYVKGQGNPFKLSNYEEKSKVTNEVPQDFKDSCLFKVNERVFGEGDKLFKDLATYCIEMTSISSLITSKGGRVALNSTSAPEDTAGWTGAWGRYIKESVENKWGVGDWNICQGKCEFCSSRF